MFRRALALALLSLLAAAASPAREHGLPLVQNFPTRDYQEHNQTWTGVQDGDGVLYFGNRGCVLRYDGTRWSSLAVPNTTFVRGLALGRDDRIYVGAVNQVGYLERAPTGGRVFVSLLSHLPPDQRDFKDIWVVSVLPDGAVGFLGTDRVLLWRQGAFAVLPVSRRGIGSRDAVYDVDPERGLSRLDRDRFVALSGDAFFKTTALEFILTEGEGSLLIGSRQRGLFRFADGTVAPLRTEADRFLTTAGLRAGRRLADGSLALSTRQDGIVLLSADLRLISRLDVNNGLASPTVRAFLPDREGGLWLSHNAGVSRVDWPAALTIFSRANGLDQNLIQELVRHDGVLYAVTASGVYHLGQDGAEAPIARFLPVREAETQRPLAGSFRGAVSTPHGLIVGAPRAVYSVRGTVAHKVLGLEQSVVTLARSRATASVLYAGLDRGIRVLRWGGGQWGDAGAIAGINAEIRSLVEDGDGTLWGSSTSHGFFRVRGADNPARAKTEFISGAGLPEASGLVYVTTWRDRPLFCLKQGLFTHDAATGQFTPVTEFGPRLQELEIATQGTDAPNRLWLRTYSPAPDAGPWRGRRIQRAWTDGRWEALPYAYADLANDSRLFLEEQTPNGDVLWIVGSEVLLRVELARAFVAPAFARPLLRSASVQAGEALPYARNGVGFEFVAPAYRPLALLEYQTQLVGFETVAAPWSKSPERSFTNLPEGRYTFRVRARDSDGTVSEPVELAFRVLPPWWRTWWAGAGYGVVGFMAVAGLVRLRVAGLRRRNAQLEALVAARTAELRANEETLRQARDTAEAASRAKSAFLANMSHELRTPLNAVLGYARMLHRDDSLSAVNRQRAGAIDQSGNHLLQVINDVLDLSKIEAGKLALRPAPMALTRLLPGVADTFRALAFEKGLQFVTEFSPDLPEAVIADEHRLRQVFFNLLGNAVKFTPHGTITFRVQRAGAALRFEVADTGIGIPEEKLRAIFLPFYQVQTAWHAQGTGLGLTISQRIVELMGGTLAVESTPDVGSRFWFDLVLESAALAAPIKPLAITGYTGERRRLLVVDDEAVNRDVARGLLEPFGFVVHEAGDGRCALEQVATLKPHAVLLDLRMPGLDGFATARQLRALPQGAHLRVIAVSASVFEENRQDAIDAGCDEFLPKPIQLDRTLGVLQRLLGLEWTHAETSSQAPFFPGPDRTVIDSLYALALSGEVDQLRRQLAELAHADARFEPFVRSLDSLAERFQMKRIREILLNYKHRSE
jgi:signal transduction histidine kinase/CheY-like chemotaxis protein